MRKLLLILTLFLFGSFSSNAQYVLDSTSYSDLTESTAYDHAINGGKNDKYAPDWTFFGGPTGELTIVGLEFGGLAALTWRDRFAIGAFSQWRLNGEAFYGGYTQFIINPEDQFFHIGFSAKIGSVNHKYIILQPAMEMQMTLNNYTKLAIGIGFAYSFASLQVRWLFGNFRPKYWKSYWTTRKLENFEERYNSNGYYD